MRKQEYTDMSDKDKIKNNELFFEELKQRYEEASKIDVIGQLSHLLATKATLPQIKSFLLEDENKRIGNLDNRYVECLRLLKIAEIEEYLGIKNVFQQFAYVNELVDTIQYIRFYLRRIEFGWEYDEWKEISDFIKAHEISFVVLCKLCCEKKVRRPSYIINKLSMLYDNIGMSRESMLIKIFYEKQV